MSSQRENNQREAGEWAYAITDLRPIVSTRMPLVILEELRTKMNWES